MQLLPDPPPVSGGAIAQLGERLVCNQKVAGSIPAGSTSSPAALTQDRVMTRVHANRTQGSNMTWRDHAIRRVVAGDANERIVCSLTIWKVFVLTLNFQAKI